MSPRKTTMIHFAAFTKIVACLDFDGTLTNASGGQTVSDQLYSTLVKYPELEELKRTHPQLQEAWMREISEELKSLERDRANYYSNNVEELQRRLNSNNKEQTHAYQEKYNACVTELAELLKAKESKTATPEMILRSTLLKEEKAFYERKSFAHGLRLSYLVQHTYDFNEAAKVINSLPESPFLNYTLMLFDQYKPERVLQIFNKMRELDPKVEELCLQMPEDAITFLKQLYQDNCPIVVITKNHEEYVRALLKHNNLSDELINSIRIIDYRQGGTSKEFGAQTALNELPTGDYKILLCDDTAQDAMLMRDGCLNFLFCHRRNPAKVDISQINKYTAKPGLFDFERIQRELNSQVKEEVNLTLSDEAAAALIRSQEQLMGTSANAERKLSLSSSSSSDSSDQLLKK
jgi:phosphoglycolate phosphatase-like HAD superfamily hydrolase